MNMGASGQLCPGAGEGIPVFLDNLKERVILNQNTFFLKHEDNLVQNKKASDRP